MVECFKATEISLSAASDAVCYGADSAKRLADERSDQVGIMERADEEDEGPLGWQLYARSTGPSL